MPVSSIRTVYLLSEAYELVGRHLFGTTWNGNELITQPCPSPRELGEARAPLETRLLQADAELADLEQQIRRTLSEAEINGLVEQRKSVMERRVELHQELRRNPAPTEIHTQEYETHQRGKTAERTLIDGLARGSIKATNGYGYPIESWLWNGHLHFRYNLRLSIVRLPRAVSARRHQPARINDQEFDAWCKTLDVLTPSASQALSVKDQCRRWFVDQLRTGRDWTKAEYLQHAQDQILGLSARTFEAVWVELAPDSLRKSGRRR